MAMAPGAPWYVLLISPWVVQMLTYIAVIIGIHAGFVTFGPRVAEYLLTRFKTECEQLRGELDKRQQNEDEVLFYSNEIRRVMRQITRLQCGLGGTFPMLIICPMLIWASAGMVMIVGDTMGWVRWNAMALVFGGIALLTDWALWFGAFIFIRLGHGPEAIE